MRPHAHARARPHTHTYTQAGVRLEDPGAVVAALEAMDRRGVLPDDRTRRALERSAKVAQDHEKIRTREATEIRKQTRIYTRRALERSAKVARPAVPCPGLFRMSCGSRGGGRGGGEWWKQGRR